MVFVYDLQKVLKEKFKCQCSETKLKIPKDASLSAFIRSKNIVQGWGQGMIDAHSRKNKNKNMVEPIMEEEFSAECLESKCFKLRLS